MSRSVERLVLAATLALAASACAAAYPAEVNPALAIARLDEVPRDGALYSVSHELYVVDSTDAGLIALSQRDPHRGCRIAYLDADETIDFMTMEPEARFYDPCHGSQYDITGHYLTGPSREDLRRVAIEVVAGFVVIDPAPSRDA